MTETLYALVVFSKSCGIPNDCLPVYVDTRPMTFAQCRIMRRANQSFYVAEQKNVWIVCFRE